jgi:cytochrome c-type biogenesis protein
MLVDVIVAFGGGLVSFLSPCVLPMVPGYLSLVSGLSVSELSEPEPHELARIALNTAFFVLGFTVVFVLLGLSATSVGSGLKHHQIGFTRASGVLVLLMALYIAGSQVLRTPRLYQEARFHPRLTAFGPFAAPVAGAAFAFGWTPCLGPVLASVLTVAAREGAPWKGGVELVAYSAGMGVPFLVVGLAFGHLARPLAWVKRHFVAITMVSAAFLAGFGVLLVLDKLSWVTVQLQHALDAVGLKKLVELG